jgi:hypothetical protein
MGWRVEGGREKGKREGERRRRRKEEEVENPKYGREGKTNFEKHFPPLLLRELPC